MNTIVPNWFPKLEVNGTYVGFFDGVGSIAIKFDDLKSIAKESDASLWDCIKRGLSEGLLGGCEPVEPANIWCMPEKVESFNFNRDGKDVVVKPTWVYSTSTTHS